MVLEPKKTLRKVLKANPRKNVALIAILFGLVEGLYYFISLASVNLVLAVFVCLVFFPLLGLVQIFFLGWLTYKTGRLLGGKGTSEELISATAYSSIVNIESLVLLFGVGLLLQVSTIFILLFFFVLVGIAVSINTTLTCISEAHAFSKWRALFSLILSGLLLQAIIWVFFIVLLVAYVLIFHPKGQLW
jgi:hypothetical protein